MSRSTPTPGVFTIAEAARHLQEHGQYHGREHIPCSNSFSSPLRREIATAYRGIFPASTSPTRSLLLVPCGRPARLSDSANSPEQFSLLIPLRLDPPRSVRASQTRISLGIQTR